MTAAAPILAPLFALAAWTGLVLLLIPVARIRAALRGQVDADDFRHGESARVPPAVSLPNRNYMNLLELPVLFYVAGLILHVTGGGSSVALGLAWAYVALRVLHSLVHLTINHVLLRLGVFALSNGVLAALWVAAALQVWGGR